ncbi:hypothetical protein HDU98_002764, partial [Podochytrium sp. JEL0797]
MRPTLLQAAIVGSLSSVAFGNTGRITYFANNWNDVTVACGKAYPPQNPLLFAALSVHSLSNKDSIIASGDCGRCLQLNGPLGSVVVTVV